MGKRIKGSDETHWSTTYTDNKGQSNDLTGRTGSDKHCHMWNDAEGDAGATHRGECKICDDVKNADQNPPNEGSSGGSGK